MQGETEKAMTYLTNLGTGFQTVASTARLGAEEQKKVLEQQVIDTEVNAQLMEAAYKQGVDGVTEEMVKTAREQAEAAKKEFHTVGGNITKGIATGAEKEEWTLSGVMSNLVSKALAAAKKAAGIESPSKLFKKEVGSFIGLGVAAGIDDSTDDIVGSVDNQIEAIRNAYDMGEIGATLGADVTPTNATKKGNTIINYTNNFKQAYTSRHELYKSKQQTAAAVRLAMGAR